MMSLILNFSRRQFSAQLSNETSEQESRIPICDAEIRFKRQKCTPLCQQQLFLCVYPIPTEIIMTRGKNKAQFVEEMFAFNYFFCFFMTNRTKCGCKCLLHFEVQSLKFYPQFRQNHTQQRLFRVRSPLRILHIQKIFSKKNQLFPHHSTRY